MIQWIKQAGYHARFAFIDTADPADGKRGLSLPFGHVCVFRFLNAGMQKGEFL